MKKLDTVRVTGGKESNILCELAPPIPVSGPVAKLSPPMEPPVMDDAAQEDLLSFRSSDPKY